IGIHYYYVNDPSTYPVIDALISKLESLEANVVFTSFTYKDPNSTKWLIEDGKARVDALITLTSFRLWSHDEEKGIEYLKALNVTPIKAIMEYYYNVSEWENATGLNPQSIAWQISLPELDGLTEFVIVGAKNKTTKAYEPIEYQIEWIARRALKWAELHRKSNEEKKVAIIYYNHGGGKDNIGASYLDVPASLEVLLKAMKSVGYRIDGDLDKELLTRLLMSQGINIGSWRKEELENLTKTAVLIPEEKYLKWFEELPEDKRREVVETWGKPPGEIMVFENETGKFIVIPLINLGNVILAPQPSRGWLENATILYHNKSLPPHHQYIAFYLWLSKEFKADAIVHFGTHGTQEWLPGKETGLSARDCWPAILINDLPVVYPYIMDNVGEGTQAKRRGQAVIVDHLTPPLIESGLYGNLSLLHEKIHQYFEAKDERLKAELRKTIESIYKELELEFLGNVSEMDEEEFESFLQTRLHEYLHELSSTAMPYGLHVLGVVRNDEITLGFIKAMLGRDFKQKVSNLKPITEPDDEAILYDLLRDVLFNGTDPIEAQKKWLDSANDSVTEELGRALKYYYDLMNCTIEIPRILQALDGKYIPPRIGGDPIRKPEALPTGNNFYSFDPREIPTKEAWNVAVKLVDDLLRRHYEEKGKFPETIAYVLWATETMRNYGVMQAAVFYTMGVSVKWDSRGRVSDVSLIPLSDLKLKLSNGTEIQRPRIDVVIVSSGLHRDTFSALMLLLDKAVKLCIDANEDPGLNYVRKHYAEIKDRLAGKGYSLEDADEAARLRIFSESPGNYGTGLPDAIGASNTWESDAKLAELFINRVGFAYGRDSWGISAADLFAEVLKNVDVAVHSRSTNLFAALDNDDVYQYLGGIALAVRNLRGENPETYIFDARNAKDPRVLTLSEFIATEIHTRYFNPKWIQGVMENDYAGARLIAEVIENIWGWDVVMPDLISDKTWQNFYEIYVRDKYDLKLREFFEKNNPYALQSIVARMLEAIRKDYWKTPEEIKIELAKELERLQKEYGFACCHHTCGNVELLSYAAGILSSLPKDEKQEVSGAEVVSTPYEKKEEKQDVKKRSRIGSFGGWQVQTTPSAEKATNQSSVGFEQTLPLKAEERSVEEDTGEVVGYKMEVSEETPKGFEVTTVPIVAIAMVLLALITFYAGMRKR
ncbi:MAG: cobaltochelatase subunit CobN, partial [Archaeoglobaceae archaeon]